VQNWIVLCPAERKEELIEYVTKLSCLAKKPKILMNR
jgi:hypothetical protein